MRQERQWLKRSPPNPLGVTMGHLHMNSKDIEANKKIFDAMGGTAMKNSNFRDQ